MINMATMLPMGDNHVVKDVTLHYCLASLATYGPAAFIVYWTEYYLHAGRREYLNVLLIFLFVEIIKWICYRMIIERDYRVNYKKKALPFYSLFVKSFDIVHLVKTLSASVVGALCFSILAILLGAEMFSKYEETGMFGVQMSILTVFPLCLNFGLSSVPHLMSGLKPYNNFHQLVCRCVQGTIFGAWIGAVVIPLDWDRPWQVWPIPNLFCALFMCAFSYFAMYCHMFLIPMQMQNLLSKKK